MTPLVDLAVVPVVDHEVAEVADPIHHEPVADPEADLDPDDDLHRMIEDDQDPVPDK